MGQRRIFFGLAAAVLLVNSTADARTWTDRNGNQVRGEFVRIHEGKVVISHAGKVDLYPFDAFSEEDQDYVREKLEAKGQGHLVPPKVGGGTSGRSVVGGPDGSDGEAPEPDVEREWTDKNGRKMEAQFVRVSGDKAEFIKNGQEVSFAFFDFSLADQNYLRAYLVSRGRESEIPNRQSGSGFSPMEGMPGGMEEMYDDMEEMYGDMEGMPGGSGYPGASGGRSGYPRPPRVSVHPPSMPTPPSYGSGGYPGAGGPDLSPDLSSGYTPPSYPSPTTPSYTPPSITRPSTPSTSDYASGLGAQKEVVSYMCESCKAILPSTVKVGDKCPSCGVYFAFGEDEFGNRTTAKPRIFTGALNIFFGVVVIVVALGVLVAKLSGS